MTIDTTEWIDQLVPDPRYPMTCDTHRVALVTHILGRPLLVCPVCHPEEVQHANT